MGLAYTSGYPRRQVHNPSLSLIIFYPLQTGSARAKIINTRLLGRCVIGDRLIFTKLRNTPLDWSLFTTYLRRQRKTNRIHGQSYIRSR